ncbi:hypothetical protein TRFO_04721 [Tritrichomonas foetus]|uniref:Uncharacterized protein n=1 Tax=Tritrichomonas foetus TaxID=1144522 RepID=A0A1J4KCG0_9EUKA|nr:hypothetical protein TRFO_04721 [Tritrichomonas foetus]|eukprot:OHT09111.1 hypothetical protein TRFO_04721 [Tritrichomonas foetus]
MDMSEEEFAGIDAFVQQKSLVEPVITAQNLYSIYQCPDQQMYRARIQFLFNLDQFAFDQPTLEALIDMMHGAILFASDNDFSYPKAIVFLSIYLAVFQLATSSPYYLPKELYRRYERIILAHSIDRPPSATLIFELSDIKLINDFFINTFFRNIKLIINSFTQKHVMAFKTTFPVCVPIPILPPLAEMEMVDQGKSEDENNASSDQQQSAQQQGQQQTVQQRELPAKMGKSPRSPHSPHSQKDASTERSIGKGQKDTSKSAAAADLSEVSNEPEDRGPDVPVDILRGSLAQLHEKFVTDFEEKERMLVGKIKELEIKLQERPQLKKPPPKKK